MKKLICYVQLLLVSIVCSAQEIDIKKVTALASQGNAEAQYTLGVCYTFGLGVSQDNSKAAYWYQKCARQGFGMTKREKTLIKKAKKGDVVSQFNLSVNYMQGGYGFYKNYDLAFYWANQAAQQGYAPAQCNLGLMYDLGWGTSVDYVEAEKWYDRAIAKGNKKAKLNLGTLYLKPDYSNYSKGAQLLEGLVNEYEDAYNNLAIAYFHLKRYDDAIFWAAKASEKGDRSADNNLGLWYLKGADGFPADYDKAIYYCERAAKAGKKIAQHNLYIAYYNKGELLYKDKDYINAFSYLMKASDNKINPIPQAMRLLSACYRYGLGTEVDLQKEKYWMEEAAKHKDDKAMIIVGGDSFQ